MGPHIGGRATTPATTGDGRDRPPPSRSGSWQLLHRIWNKRRKNSEMSEKERDTGGRGAAAAYLMSTQRVIRVLARSPP